MLGARLGAAGEGGIGSECVEGRCEWRRGCSVGGSFSYVGSVRSTGRGVEDIGCTRGLVCERDVYRACSTYTSHTTMKIH